MTIVLFYHSLLSDWNHGNAHFLRGVATELLSRGHTVRIYEPKDAWSLQSLRAEHGERPIAEFRETYPGLDSIPYALETLDLDAALEGADLVIVHEWNDHELVRRIGRHRATSRSGGYRLLFHDTHHRAVSEPGSMAAYDLSSYDGVLAFGRVIRDLYLSRGWAARAWTWHEAADTRLFRPIHGLRRDGDLVWIGNWGDEERTAELHEFLLEPCRTLGLEGRVYGVRYPEHALAALMKAGIEYAGWLPNYQVPQVFARFKVTVHVPRRPYVQALPGIPTIRPFEAMACGIPLVTAPWNDLEGLFTPGKDFLVARNGKEMERHLWALLNDADLRCELALHARRTILARHTCRHRVDELLAIDAELQSCRGRQGKFRRPFAPSPARPVTPSRRIAPSRESTPQRYLPYALTLLPLAASLIGAYSRTTSSGKHQAEDQAASAAENEDGFSRSVPHALEEPVLNGRTPEGLNARTPEHLNT